MELARVFLLGALFLIAFMLWNAWQNEYPNTQALKTPTPVVEKQVAAAMRKLPDAQIDEGQKSQGQRFVHVKTDVLDVLIDTQGGNIVQANLLSYPERANEANSPPFQLLSNNPDSYYVSQSGIAGSDKPVLQYKSCLLYTSDAADE